MSLGNLWFSNLIYEQMQYLLFFSHYWPQQPITRANVGSLILDAKSSFFVKGYVIEEHLLDIIEFLSLLKC